MPRSIKNADFLGKARDRFRYCQEKWRDIREQHDLDAKFLAGDQWEPREVSRRKDKHLPYVTVDLLSQYINELVGDIRQNKRAVNVLPKGYGATDKSAQFLSDWVRATEYLSQAQTAYITASEQMIGSSYGFVKLETFFESPKSWNMGIKIVEIPNGNTIIFDPDCKKYDCSDAEDCFEIDFMSEDAFNRRWPKAEIKTFAEDVQEIAPDWIKPKQAQVASWWRVKTEQIQLHLVDTEKQGPIVFRDDELPQGFDKKRILKSRDYDERRIVQYVLNGVEVLETNDPKAGKGWPGQWIPIVPFWGKELFVDEGSGSKRILLSLIRKARDPQRVLNYLASQLMMEAKQTPKTKLTGPRGMFSGQSKVWEELYDDPKAFAEWDQPEGFAPGSVKPEPFQIVPNFQQYELTMQAWERRIMSSMGISPLPTAAQKNNEKSGIALERIQGERTTATYHFVDNIERSIACVGRQLVDVFDKINTMARDISARKEDGKHYVARVNDLNHAKNQPYAGEHDVTVESGPHSDSQREEDMKFADTLAQIQGVFPLIGDLIVKMRTRSPLGNLIAERLTPPQFANMGDDDSIPPQAKALLGQAQQKIQQLTQAVQQLSQEKAAKMVEKGVALQQTALQEKTKLIVAQATLSRDNAETILQSQLENLNTILDQLHEHATIAHQAEQDRATAAHAALLQPAESTVSGNNTGGGGNGQA